MASWSRLGKNTLIKVGSVTYTLICCFVQFISQATFAGALKTTNSIGARMTKRTRVRSFALIDINAELLSEILFEALRTFADGPIKCILTHLATRTKILIATVIICR